LPPHLAPEELDADQADAPEHHPPCQDHPTDRRNLRVRPTASPTTCSRPR
jgi:hypothetical protein